MIYIGADHRGFELKGKIAKWLTTRGYEVQDLGAYEYDHDDDYFDFAYQVAEKVHQAPTNSRGIVICGSGVGVDIVANRFDKVRSGLGFSEDQVHSARKDDNINVLALPADNCDEQLAIRLIEKFMETAFVESDRYLRRLEKLARFEGNYK
jgi:ribose 5-phosphate isomerase B